MSGFDFVGLVAANNNFNPNFLVFVKVALFLGATLLISIVRKVAEMREKANRQNTPGKPSPPPAKKDNPFRNEIEAFLEEVGKRRAAGDRSTRPANERGSGEMVLTRPVGVPKAEPVRKPVPLRPIPLRDREKTKPEPAKPVEVAAGPPARPGDEIAARKTPGSDDLGKQIRTHLAQYLDSSRMANQTQSDLGNAVERTVRQHLGATITGDQPEPAALPQSEASVIMPLLRDPSSIRNAIVINEILGRPKGLSRRR